LLNFVKILFAQGMKTRNLLFALLFFFATLSTSSLKAQAFEFSPEKKMQVYVYQNEDTEYHIKIKNKKSTTLLIRWEIIKNTFANGWYYTLCDNKTCYLTPLPDTATMNPIASGQEGEFKVAFNATDVKGEGELKIRIYDDANPSDVDTVTYYFNTLALSIEENPVEKAVKLYPNPVKDALNLDLGQSGFAPVQAMLYNVTGQKVKEMIWTSQNNLVNVSGFDPGVYYLALIDKNGVRVVKQFYKTN
jgi:hypothetical protein